MRSRSGGQLDRHDVEPVEEVLAEGPFQHRLFEVAVGGRDHARVDAHVALAAEARELAVLEHLQELGLEAGCISLISSRKIVPWLAYSNLPSLRFCAPVKAPFSKPKSSLSSSSEGSAAQLTFTKGRSRRLESWKTVRATSFLAGAALAADQHRDVGVGDLLDDLAHLAHLRVVAAEHQQLGLGAHTAAQLLDLLPERALLERLVEGDLELLDLEGLAQEIGGAELHRLDDGARLAVTRQHDHRNLRQALLQPSQRLESVHAGQHEVERHEVGARIFERPIACSPSATAKT